MWLVDMVWVKFQPGAIYITWKQHSKEYIGKLMSVSNHNQDGKFVLRTEYVCRALEMSGALMKGKWCGVCF